MGRERRMFVEGSLYHVYNRFARGEDVFADPQEAVEFAELLREVKKRDGLKIIAWALLSNHYHIAVRVSAVPLSRTMHRLQGGFAKGFNRRWRRSGPLWQSRFQARMVDTQEYCEQVILYIHLNPVRAGLVEDPADYAFCGHREIVKRTHDPLLDVDHALMSFGSTLKTARKSYRERIRAGLKDARSLGWDGVFESFGPRDRTLHAPESVFVDELGRSTGRERPALDTGLFLQVACSLLGAELEGLASAKRDSATAASRKLIAAVGIERWGQRAGHVARLLNKHPVAVSRWVSAAAQQRHEDADFAEKMEKLDQALSAWALDAQSQGKL